MSTLKHTPGPWAIYDDISPIIMGRKSGENYDIAILPTDYLPPAEIQANARLLAAAPNLLTHYKSYWNVIIPVVHIYIALKLKRRKP